MPASTVATPTPSYNRQYQRWRMLEDLCGGTDAMIAAGERWLAKEEAELPKSYERRIKGSVLYPMFADTLDTGVARMFSRVVQVKEADRLSERLGQIENDSDLAGTSLTQFGRRLARDGMKYGRFHFIVEFPDAVKTGATKRPDKEKESGVNPYFADLCPTNIIGWKFRKGAGGKQILAQLRVRETAIVDDGEFGEKEVESIRVYIDDGEGARWELHTKNDKGEYAPSDSGPITLGRIPLVSAYYDYIAPFEANPPYEGLAWQNIRHWRSSSEQDNLLRIARVPIVTAVGLKAEEIAAGLTIGAGRIFASTNPEAKFSFTEHSGAAIGAGAEDIKRIEERGEALGMAPMLKRTGTITATQTAVDESKSNSDLEAWARVTESAIKQGYEMAAEWVKEDLPEEFGIDIATQSDMLLEGDQGLATLDAARTRGDVTHETYLEVLKAKRILPKDLDVAAEAQSARDNPPMGMMTGGMDDVPPAEDEVETETGEAA